MCGIAGVISVQNVEASCVEAMALAQAHRGPDDRGFFQYGVESGMKLTRSLKDGYTEEVCFSHQRLSILDLSKSGWQPMTTPDSRFTIVFNGEIYNYLELRAELESLGWSFRSHSDTEVLLYGYAQWRAGVLNRLVGMFAFAIFDLLERSVFLARDFFGIKPLFYSSYKGGIAFSSEIKAQLTLPDFSRRAHPEQIYNYLRFGMTDRDEQTLFRDIKRLPAAHYMIVKLDAPQAASPVRYWQVNLINRSKLSFEDAARKLRELFLESVKLHLRSDVPVGAALSGGIDSSAIVGAIRHLSPNQELHTFSYIADDERLSEDKWVNIAGKAAGITMHKVCPRPDDLIADLDNLIDSQDEPFGSTSIYAQQRVFRLAHEAGIKVMMDGQGADELLAGYTSYISARFLSLMRQNKPFRALAFGRNASKLPHVTMQALLTAAGSMALPTWLKPLARKLRGLELMPEWINQQWFAEQGVFPGEHQREYSKDMLRVELAESLKKGLPALLRYEDQNSMFYSVESRVPFLTPKLADFIYSLPEEYLIDHNGTTKSIFRRAMHGIVPDEILDRRDKIGFATPEQDWLEDLGPWVENVLKQNLESLPMLKADVILAEWDRAALGNHPSGLWRWVNLCMWVKIKGVEFE